MQLNKLRVKMMRILFKACCDCLGIPYLIRKALLFATPTVDIVKSPDPEHDWSITIHEAFKSVEMKFKYGTEFEEVLPMATFRVTLFLTQGKGRK
jgi:hypothetical protein